MSTTAARQSGRAISIGKVPITLTINGQARSPNVGPWTTLIDLLREVPATAR